MDLNLANKIIFIAGASRGIGRGIAESLLQEGAKVALSARGAETLAQTHAALAERYGADRLWSMAGDMTQSADIERAFDACERDFGPIDGAVANVGISPSPLGVDVSDDDWQAGLDQNLNSAFRLARAAMQRMGARKRSALVFISSIAGVDTMGSALIYGAAKAAVNHLAKALSRFAAETGVRVNTIAPGNIIFPGGTWEAASTGPRADAWARWLKREVPLRRYGEPREIGDVAAFLLSDRASFINGATIVVDGGQTR
jgi:3-oxoacyl-[acyl-carrier protein] reductase